MIVANYAVILEVIQAVVVMVIMVMVAIERYGQKSLYFVILGLNMLLHFVLLIILSMLLHWVYAG